MGFYKNVVVPRLCHLSMRKKRLLPYRRRAIWAAEGRVLEIGAGSGLNFELYPPAVSEIVALEPDRPLLVIAGRHANQATRPVRFVKASAEQVPLDDKSIDTVVTTWTLCTIPHADQALREMRRVLQPSGRLLFVEHGLAPEPRIQKWQTRLAPMFERVSGGCHLNRPIDNLIEQAGFRIDALETGYMPGPKMLTFLYTGVARPA